MSRYEKGEFRQRLILTLSVIGLCVIILIAVLRFSGDPNATFSFVEYGEGILIEGYSGDPTTLEVPEKIDGKKVVAIGESAFLNQPKLKKIVLPETVTEIGATAFADCKVLSHVEAPGVVTVGEAAFQNCENLKTILLSSALVMIDDRAFHSCGKLESLTVSSSLERIGTDALAGCGNLVLITGGNPVAEEVARQYNLATDIDDTGNGMWMSLGLTTAGLLVVVLLPMAIISKRKKNK
ncbi:MAG: leucine-rich repeat domain-containing protein [Oscillospiraceae bacterium]|nr:leucine-rich repeat domain-containing protein [Oscillospiraceae bacterium]